MVEVRRRGSRTPGPNARMTIAVACVLAIAGAIELIALLTVPGVAHSNIVRARLVAGPTPTRPRALPTPARAPDAGTGTPSIPTIPTIGRVALTGCPPPPRKPGPPASPPWHPAALVPEAALPAPPTPTPRLASPATAVLAGKGLWIWQPRRTEAGNVDAIVKRAVAAGLTSVWVRVGDSQSGFYAAPFLTTLVPAAHQQGLAVIGWGFPHLYDPIGDARWTAAALAWQAPSGDRLDGWSADIETASEGTALSGRRAAAYLGSVRPLLNGRPLVATVFPPTDYWWSAYPYQAMAPYIDAFAPMLYWGCREPGDLADSAIRRLAALAPVHVIGQAYDMAPEGGRVGSPTGAEILRFLDVARRDGASGASFWSWQAMSADEWTALSAYPWLGPVNGRVDAGPG